VIRDAWWIAAKDIRIEARARDIVPTMTLFGVLVAVLSSMAMYVDPRLGRTVAPGVLWISVAFAGTLGITRTWSREREAGAIRSLLMTGVSPGAIFLGKALGAFAFVTATLVVVAPLVAVLLQAPLAAYAAPFTLFTVLGTVGFVSAGTLFGALGARASARELMIAVVVYPLVSPAILCGVVATRELLHGVALAQLWDWVKLLVAFDVLFVAGGIALMGSLLTE
jgi:heme exporter protein B